MDTTSKKIDVYKLIIPLFLLLEVRFFYLFSVGSLDGFIMYKNKVFISLFAIAVFSFSLALKKKIKIDKITAWCLIFTAYVVFEIARNISTYHLTWYRALVACHGYFLLLFYPALTIYSDKEKLYQYLIKTLTMFSIILSAVFFIQAIVYNTAHISFLYVSEYKVLSNASIRNYGIRLTEPGTLIIFSTLISFGQILGKNKNKMHIVNIISGLLYIIYVCQTRMTTYIIILAMLLIIFFKLTKNRFNKLKVFMITIISVIVLIGPYIIDDLFETDEDASVIARVYAVETYTKSFLKHPLFGIGLLPDDKADYTTNKIMRGSRGYAHITDVGYVGYIFLFGLGGIILLVILIRILYKIIKNCKIKDGAYYSLITCLVYIILTCATLSIFDTQRIVILPFVLYIANYLQYKNSSDKMIQKE